MDTIQKLFGLFRNTIPKISETFISKIQNNKSLTTSFIFFLVYIVIYYLLFTRYHSTLFDKYSLLTNILLLSIGIIWGFSLFIKYENKSSNFSTTFYNLVKNFGIIVIGLVMILGIIYLLTSNDPTSNLLGLLLNFTIILSTIYTIYYFTKDTSTVKKYSQNKLFALFYHILFVIPCLFIDTFLFVSDDIKRTPKFVFIILLVQLISFVIYFGYPYVLRSIYTYNANMLLNKPVYTDKKHIIGTFEDLKPQTSKHLDDFNYNYGISGWFFLDNVGENYNSESNEYTTLFSYGEKPTIEFNPSENSLRITMKQGLDGTKIIYSSKNVPLQRWNNFVINYNGGQVDVFLNSKLVASESGSVPYMKYDNVVVGTDKGIPGGACNILYYHTPIHKTTIGWLYEYFRRLTPPIIS